MNNTKIEWANMSWNPVTGCMPVSVGCKNCYAQRMARRLAGRHGYPEAPNHFDVTLHPDRLDQPLKIKRPKRIFVCSMSDFFNVRIPSSFRKKMIDVMINAYWHTFILLTKRAENIGFMFDEIDALLDQTQCNMWIGITAELQLDYDTRIDYLVWEYATCHFISIEPMLGKIDLRLSEHPEIGWVVVGGETGPGSRPVEPEWVRNIRDQCVNAGVSFFFKKWGKIVPEGETQHTIDGREWVEFPRL